ncbi:hypothetical protein HDU97_008406 [Phlyctochytrium planicorne]|nr:hypothetical protein HDU97_008406 [Phlyctochytrium planicorne]
MLNIKAIIALSVTLVASSSSVEAGFWFHLFPTCLTSQSISAPDSRVFYATSPSEPTVCGKDVGSSSYSYVAVNETTIVRSACNQRDSSSPEASVGYNKFTGGIKDCLTNKVFFPIPSTSSDNSITTNQILNNLPPVDWMVASTAVIIQHNILSIPAGGCQSKALSSTILTPIWETCSKLPHKQGSVYSNFKSNNEFDGGRSFRNGRYSTDDCTGTSKDETTLELPPISGGSCIDTNGRGLGSSVTLATAKFPGWPLEKTSNYPTDDAPYTVKVTGFGDFLPTAFDGDYALFPFSYKDDLSSIPASPTSTFGGVPSFTGFPTDFPTDVPTGIPTLPTAPGLPSNPVNNQPKPAAFNPPIPVKPSAVVDNSFDAYPDVLKTTPVILPSGVTSIPGLGGNGKPNGSVEGFRGGVAGMLLAIALGVLVL